MNHRVQNGKLTNNNNRKLSTTNLTHEESNTSSESLIGKKYISRLHSINMESNNLQKLQGSENEPKSTIYNQTSKLNGRKKLFVDNSSPASFTPSSEISFKRVSNRNAVSCHPALETPRLFLNNINFKKRKKLKKSKSCLPNSFSTISSSQKSGKSNLLSKKTILGSPIEPIRNNNIIGSLAESTPIAKDKRRNSSHHSPKSISNNNYERSSFIESTPIAKDKRKNGSQHSPHPISTNNNYEKQTKFREVINEKNGPSCTLSTLSKSKEKDRKKSNSIFDISKAPYLRYVPIISSSDESEANVVFAIIDKPKKSKRSTTKINLKNNNKNIRTKVSSKSESNENFNSLKVTKSSKNKISKSFHSNSHSAKTKIKKTNTTDTKLTLKRTRASSLRKLKEPLDLKNQKVSKINVTELENDCSLNPNKKEKLEVKSHINLTKTQNSNSKITKKTFKNSTTALSKSEESLDLQVQILPSINRNKLESPNKKSNLKKTNDSIGTNKKEKTEITVITKYKYIPVISSSDDDDDEIFVAKLNETKNFKRKR